MGRSRKDVGKKAEKRAEKREKLMSKVVVVKKKPKEKARRKKTPAVPSFATLQDLLPELDESAMDTSAGSSRTTNVTTTTPAIATAEKNHFGAVVGHPAFQANPLGTVQEHLENYVKMAPEKRAKIMAQSTVSGNQKQTKKGRGKRKGSAT
mmetsp:Transcript_26315/g.73556  ORF Transcript_26315/g.73556 Transcript_26315/m.73556 type:complete len:151 (+) Transcript_26315:51-503(+)